MFTFTLKPKPPRCPVCQRRLKPVEVISTHDLNDPMREADWYCLGGGRSWEHGPTLHFSTKYPVSKSAAYDDGEFNLRAVS